MDRLCEVLEKLGVLALRPRILSLIRRDPQVIPLEETPSPSSSNAIWLFVCGIRFLQTCCPDKARCCPVKSRLFDHARRLPPG